MYDIEKIRAKCMEMTDVRFFLDKLNIDVVDRFKGALFIETITDCENDFKIIQQLRDEFDAN